MALVRNWTLVFYALILVLILAALYVAKEWAMWSRYLSYPGDAFTTPIGWYRPTERVPGLTDSVLPVAKGSELSISYDALKEAMDFAKAHQSEALIIARHGKVELEKYWYDTSRESTFNPQGMSATLVALLIGIAIAEGEIESVDDKLAKYAPELAGDARREITIRDALEMASGLAQIPSSSNPFSRHIRHFMGTDFQRQLLVQPLAGPPGERFDYNAVNTNLLGLVLERAVGQRYAQYLGEKLWSPIGAADATMYLDRNVGFVMVSCCLFSSPMDWFRVGQLILDKGKVGPKQVVPEAWIHAMLAPSRNFDGYGFHVWRGVPASANHTGGQHHSPPCGQHEEEFVSKDLIYLCGTGYQRAYVVPSLDLVVVRTGGPTGGLASEWDEAALPNIVVRGVDQP